MDNAEVELKQDTSRRCCAVRTTGVDQYYLTLVVALVARLKRVISECR